MYGWPRSVTYTLTTAEQVRERMPVWEKERLEQDQRYAELREKNLKERRGATRERWQAVKKKAGDWGQVIMTAAKNGQTSTTSAWWHEEPDPLFIELLEEAGYEVKVESRPILDGMIPKTQWKFTISW